MFFLEHMAVVFCLLDIQLVIEILKLVFTLYLYETFIGNNIVPSRNLSEKLGITIGWYRWLTSLDADSFPLGFCLYTHIPQMMFVESPLSYHLLYQQRLCR